MSSANSLRLSAKLALAPALVILMLLAVAGLGAFGMQGGRTAMHQIADVRTPNLLKTIELGHNVQRVRSLSYQFLAWTNASYSEGRLKKLQGDLQTASASVVAGSAEVAKIIQAEGGQHDDDIVRKATAFSKAIADAVDMAGVDQSVATTQMLGAEKSFDEIMAAIEAVRRSQAQQVDEAVADARATANSALAWIVGVAVLSVALSIAISGAVRRSILRSIHAIREAARRLKEGDLTLAPPATGNDEVALTAQALAATVETLRQTIGAINLAASQIDRAVGEIASGNNDLSVRTERQAASLEQTAASMSELSSTVSDNATGARSASGLARESCSSAERGGAIVAQVVSVMTEISESAGKIKDIIGVIDSIAFQTNILALNAAVEASRAGEHGRGFGVVAEEVRTLAHRSAQSAAEIRRLIATSTERVAAGTTLVREAGGAMQRIVQGAQQLSTMVDEIAQASQRQSDAVKEVAHAVSDMDRTTQQNAALVEQSAAAASSMKQESQRLVLSVAMFRFS